MDAIDFLRKEYSVTGDTMLVDVIGVNMKLDIVIRLMDRYADTKQKLNIHSVMQVPQFEQLLQVRLEELPYTKHLDDGQYNDGQAYGFECGARWAYEKLSSGTAVGQRSVGTNAEARECETCKHLESTNPYPCGKCDEDYSMWEAPSGGHL